MTMRTFYVILVSAVCTLTLRALPFVLFRKDKAMPAWLSRLGEALPSAIMAVLVVYCLKDIPAQPIKAGAPQLLGVAIVALTYRWKRNTLLSIVITYPDAELRDQILATGMVDGMETSYARLESVLA